MVDKLNTQLGQPLNERFAIKQANWDDPDHLIIGQTQAHQLFNTLSLSASPTPAYFEQGNAIDLDAATFVDDVLTGRAITTQQFLNRRLFNDGLLVVHRDKIVHESYRNNFEADDRHVIDSCTKSLCAMLMAQEIDAGRVDVANEVGSYINELASVDAWQGVTVQHVLDMCTGIEYSEDYSNPNADYWGYARAVGYYPTLDGEPALGAKAWIATHANKRACAPGSKFEYNSTLTMVMGWLLENVTGQSLASLFEQRLFAKMGTASQAYFNTDRFGFCITEGQLSLTLQDFARAAYANVNHGKSLLGEQILPQWYIDGFTQPNEQLNAIYGRETPMFKAPFYHNHSWCLQPETGAYTMLGIHGQFAYANPSKQLLIVSVGSYPKQDGALMMSSLKQLWQQVELLCN